MIPSAELRQVGRADRRASRRPSPRRAPTPGSRTAPRSASSSGLVDDAGRSGSRSATCSTSGSIPAPRTPSRWRPEALPRPRRHQARARRRPGPRHVPRRLRPASRLVPVLAARELRHARPRALRRRADARLRPRREGRRRCRSRWATSSSPQDVMKKSGADILRLWVAASDYSDDLRIGPEILQDVRRRPTASCATRCAGCSARSRTSKPSDARRRSRTCRRAGAADAASARASSIARSARPTPTYDYRKVVGRAVAVHEHGPVRVLLRHPQGRALLRGAIRAGSASAALTVIEQIFRCADRAGWRRSCRFTAEEAWLARYRPDAKARCISRRSPRSRAAWRDDALAEKWELVRDVRRVVTGALEIERAAKKHRLDPRGRAATSTSPTEDAAADGRSNGVDLAEICITVRRRGHRKARRPRAPSRCPTCRASASSSKRARGQEVRALVAHHQGCRRRSGLSRPVGARRRRRARDRPRAKAVA